MSKKFIGTAALAAIATTLCLAAANRSQACAIPLPQPPLWVEDAGTNLDGNQEYLIGVELAGLFTDVTPGQTSCACGLQFSSPLPFGSDVTEAFVAVTNRQTHDFVVVPGFDFAKNTETSDGLDGEFAGFENNWFGLATEAFDATVTQPAVGAGEVLKLWYRVEIREDFGEFDGGEGVAASHHLFDPDEVFSASNMLFATGAADANGVPDFTGAHQMVTFSATEVPEPASIVLAATMLLGWVGLRRRS